MFSRTNIICIERYKEKEVQFECVSHYIGSKFSLKTFNTMISDSKNYQRLLEGLFNKNELKFLVKGSSGNFRTNIWKSLIQL